MNNYDKILIIGPSWLGDSVISQTIINILKKKQKTKIDIVTPKYCRELYCQIPEVNKIIINPLQHGTIKLNKIYQFSKMLRKEQYEQAIILPNSFKAALIPVFAKIPLRTGWRGEMRYGILNDLRILDKKKFPLIIQRYAALAFEKHLMKNFNDLPSPLPLPKISIQKKKIKRTLQKFKINNKRPLIGMCPGYGSNSAKCWPYYYYASLTSKLIEYGYQIAIFGSIKNKQIGLYITHEINIKNKSHYHNLVGATSLNETINLIANCEAIVSNDSGLMHVASALNCPTIILSGLSTPHIISTPPLSQSAYIMQSTIKNTQQKINYQQNLIEIKPIKVLNTLHNLLSKIKEKK
ncbi:lipopolysaccharide heptosyltransferase II [Blochmannia endosymbiont of Colobopsis nipponica]|uniref:lipopolysaccharide heptosyltransferase II n=1 Tax=Blochmannia endosymbiont of Colobopsis nipponica TaxID=2681987 RepID=UPI00178281B6|nr:lipopolysaccharide heptosyltransferase II [Blochmannia endosymbiont of Colobopsis nipponica]QOI10866.1 lipopolysaccharide heptosyltransferase II [Blochmannia endosymbiont of Colobopsis nipponica]